jgi:S-adenosylmethionine-diacylgycerolhomoserine-N-methlytransferase
MNAPAKGTAIERYYRFHARIYDSTRWSFLFGRTAILGRAAGAGCSPRRILEVGCGTGANLVRLCRRFPQATIAGLDLSEAMLARARSKTEEFGARVRLLHRAYDAPLREAEPFDLILFSYALSMFNPGFETAIEAAAEDVAPGGHVAVVDFHNTSFPVFARWMGVNHVRMEGQLEPKLRAHFTPLVNEIRAAYGGVWRYLLFVGQKQAA